GLCLALPQDAGDDPVRVGMLLPQSAAAGQALWLRLEAASDADFTFEPAGSAQALEDNVAAGVWECGYKVADDLDARIAEGSYDGVFTRVDAPSTTLGTLTDWVVCAALLDVCAPEIALHTQLDSGLAAPDEAAALREAMAAAFGPAALLDFEIVPVAGSSAPGAAAQLQLRTGAALVRGMAALVLMLFACLCAARFAGDMTAGFFSRLRPYAGPAALYLPAWAAAGLLSTAAGLLCLGITGAFWSGTLGGPLGEAGLMLLYQLLLAAFSFALSALFRRRERLLALLPFLMTACLVLCPVLVDITHFIPALAGLSALLPPTLYLRAAAGQAGLWQMPLATLGLLAAGFVLGWARARPPRGFWAARPRP
ncbi:hypothetical protein LJC64_05110, partial [Ruminococcaceae bacterium OttesenSCG-928-A11]|nr:hypothetical protein [Ruminococcaceae bacterium OttesenSCG-928-A11]